MYLSKLYLHNWRSYADATFNFKEPSGRRSVVLVGAMNGHGKTSFLVGLYLGLFGRFGLRHCEGFGAFQDGDVGHYREAIAKYRRNSAAPDEPSVIDITLAPSLHDSDEEEVRVVRRWHFTGKNQPKQGEAFEEVLVYVGDKLKQWSSLDKDPLLLAHDCIERNLFPAHVAPAFFFDGEQAQKLIESAGEVGIKKAVEVMFGTKVIAELAETMSQYLVRVRQNAGGRRRSSDRQQELETKVREREALNDQIAKKQSDLQKLEHDKEQKERERTQFQEELARLGGAGNASAAQALAAKTAAEREQNDAEKALGEAVRSLGVSLATFRLAPAIQNRLKAEELREDWESLKRGTIDNKEKVLAVALPEPDPLLGNLSTEVRFKLRDRFADALERIYNPPPSDCAKEYLLGHVKGDARGKVLLQLAQVQSVGSARTKAAAKRLRDAREALDEAKQKLERINNVPQATTALLEKVNALSTQIQESIRKVGALENEVKKLKADHHELNKQIGEISEELARLGPEQMRLAVAERVSRALEELQEKLKPTTTARLEQCVTKHFVAIADRRFRNAQIKLPVGQPPVLCFPDGQPHMLIEMNSGFEKRAFGIAFTLALAEITRRRVPLVIDTPLGNADSEYRPRTLKALAEVDLDQVIILTHDEEVTPDLVEHIRGKVSQKFLVEYQDAGRLSVVKPDSYFKE